MEDSVAPLLSHEGTIIFVDHPRPTRLTTTAHARDYFDAVVRYWRAHVSPARATFIVNYANLSTDPSLKGVYSDQVARINTECAELIVRYGGDPTQRTMARVVGIRLQTPSRVFDTREQAMAFVRSRKSGAAKER